MNPDTNTQPNTKQEPSVPDDNTVNNPAQIVQAGNQEQPPQDPSNLSVPDDNTVNNPAQIVQAGNQEQPPQDPSLVGQPNTSSPASSAGEDNYENSIQQPVIGDETNGSEVNNQINQVGTQSQDYTNVGINTPLATDAETKSGRLIGRKRILYIFTAGVACLVIISGAVFGLVSTTKKPKTSTNVASEVNTNTQNKSSTPTQPTSSTTVASNSSNVTTVKKSASANPVLPFSSEKEDTVPVDNNVQESDPTNQEGDPVIDPGNTDTLE